MSSRPGSTTPSPWAPMIVACAAATYWTRSSRRCGAKTWTTSIPTRSTAGNRPYRSRRRRAPSMTSYEPARSAARRIERWCLAVHEGRGRHAAQRLDRLRVEGEPLQPAASRRRGRAHPHAAGQIAASIALSPLARGVPARAGTGAESTGQRCESAVSAVRAQGAPDPQVLSGSPRSATGRRSPRPDRPRLAPAPVGRSGADHGSDAVGTARCCSGGRHHGAHAEGSEPSSSVGPVPAPVRSSAAVS